MGKKDSNSRPLSWIQGARTNEMPEWIRTNPNAFRMLYEFAERARWKEGDVEYQGKLTHLKIREFITGRKSASQKIGISEQKYRTLYKRFEKLGYIKTISATKELTIAKYLADGIFFNNYPTDQPTNEPLVQPTDNLQLTTINKEKKEKNETNIHASPKVEREKDSSNKKKCPNKLEGHQGCIDFISSFAASRDVMFPTIGKQTNALHRMLEVGYSFEEINSQIDLLESQDFWQERGFDLMDVANQIGKGGLNG